MRRDYGPIKRVSGEPSKSVPNPDSENTAKESGLPQSTELPKASFLTSREAAHGRTLSRSSMEAKKPKKPKGFKAFDRLARLLVKVPKSEIPARKPKWKRKKK